MDVTSLLRDPRRTIPAQMAEEIKKLKAENERLRDALAEIVARGHGCGYIAAVAIERHDDH